MSNQTRTKNDAEPSARAQALDRTIAAYADSPRAFAEDLARAEQQLGASHINGAECNCGLCGAMADMSFEEMLATAHLTGAECGCARCMAMAALVEQANCPGPGEPMLDVAGLQRQIDEQEALTPSGAQQPAGQPAAAPAPEAHAGGQAQVAHAEQAVAESLELEQGAASLDVGTAQAEIADVVADVAAQFNEVASGANEAAFANLLAATAEVAAYAGTVVPSKPAGFPGTLGLTSWSYASWTYPDLQVDLTKRAKNSGGLQGWVDWATSAEEWVGKVKTTTVADATHSAVAAPTGKHKYTTQSLKVKGKPTNFDVQLEITPGYYTKIRDAEQEHLNDLLHAYNLSIKAAGDAVNTSTATEHVGATSADAEKKAKDSVGAKLHASLGQDPANWRTMLRTLATMTISGRDNKGWHTFGLDNAAASLVVDLKAKTITHGLTDGTTSINSANSAAVVHF